MLKSSTLFSPTWSFLSISVWNARRINEKRDFNTAREKLNIIYTHIKHFNPIFFFIIDIGRKVNIESNQYETIYAKDNKSVMLALKKAKYKMDLLNDDTRIINNYIIFTYYKPQDNDFRTKCIITEKKKLFVGDFNIKSHGMKSKIRNHKFFLEKYKFCFINIENSSKKKDLYKK